MQRSRLIAPTEGLVFLPPYLRVMAVPTPPVTLSGTLMSNLRLACGEAAANADHADHATAADAAPANANATMGSGGTGGPSDRALLSLCVALGMAPELCGAARELYLQAGRERHSVAHVVVEECSAMRFNAMQCSAVQCSVQCNDMQCAMCNAMECNVQ